MLFTDLTLLCPVAVIFLRNYLADGSWLTVFFMIAVLQISHSQVMVGGLVGVQGPLQLMEVILY